MKKKLTYIVLILISLLIIIFSVDCYSVFYKYETPPFTIKDSKTSADDGGSGTYVGLGYKFDIVGNFMPDSDYKYEGVTSCRLYVLNVPVKHFKRIK